MAVTHRTMDELLIATSPVTLEFVTKTFPQICSLSKEDKVSSFSSGVN